MVLSQVEDQLVASIAPRRDELVADLAGLVELPTGHGRDTRLDQCRGQIAQRLRSLGAVLELIPGQQRPSWLREGPEVDVAPPIPPLAILRRTNPAAKVRVLLCGHIDTVFAHDENFCALKVFADGSKATGPGCSDMKGGLLVAIAALEAIEAAGVPLSWTFAIVSDEETGSFHCDAALRAEASRGYNAGLVFEPALPDGGLVVERPGSGQFMIECRGKAAHVGRDFSHGVSAVKALAQNVVDACNLADPARGAIVSVGPLEGGAATNIVPDLARAWGNVRFFSGDAERRLAAALDAMNSDQSQLPATKVVRIFNRPAKPKTPAVEKLALLARACAEDLGQSLPFGTTGGVCDGNNLQAGGLPVIDTLGVRGGGLHTHQEWIELDSLVERAQLSAVLLARLAAGSISP